MAELLKALYDRSLTAEERLKVACFIWRQQDAPVVSRETVLAKWACEEICSAYSKKTRAPPQNHICCNLWEFLTAVLHTICQKQDNMYLSINPYLIQCMTDVFSQAHSDVSSCAENAMKVLKHLLLLPNLPPVFYKYELMVSLLLSTMKLAVADARRGCLLLQELPSILKSLLCHYVYLQGAQGNQKKVFTTTCNQLLEPSLLMKSLIDSSSLMSSSDHKMPISNALSEILSSLFGRDHLSDFTSALSSVTAQASLPKRMPTSYTRLFFQTFEKMTKPTTDAGMHEAAVSSVPTLFKAFLVQNSKETKVSKNVEFQFLTKLLQLVGCHTVATEKEPTDGDTQSSQMEWSVDDAIEWQALVKELYKPSVVSPSESMDAGIPLKVLAAVANCLDLVLKYNVYQIAEDRTLGSKQFLWLQSLSVKLLISINTSNVGSVCSCLLAIVKLNHKIVEPLFPGIWLLLFTVQQSLRQKEVDLFAQEIIEIYSKLRQLPLLLEKHIAALEMLADFDLTIQASPAFTPETEKQLAKHIGDLPPGQCIEVLEILCSGFEKKYLKAFQACPSPWKKKRRGVSTGLAVPNMAAVQQYVDVFTVILSHIPLDTWSGRTKEKALAVLQRLNVEICMPFLETVPSLPHEMQPAICSTSLHLACKCFELEAGLRAVYPNLQLHSDWLLKLAKQQSTGKLVLASWSDIMEESLGPTCDYLMRELVVLQLRFATGDDDVPVTELLDAVFTEPGIVPSDPNIAWSGQLLDISEENHHIASWSLSLSKLPILYEYCTESHLKSVADFILQGILLSRLGDRGGRVDLGGVVSFLLESEAFQEMRSLHEGLLKSCFEHAASTLPKCFSKELKKALVQASKEDVAHDGLLVILNHGLESLTEIPHSPRRIDKWLEKLSAYSKLLRAIPLIGTSPTALQRTLQAVTTWHICVVQVDSSNTPIITELQYLLCWIVHSIAKQHQKASKPSQKAVIAANIPVELLLQWLYHVARKLAKGESIFLASTLAALDIVCSLGIQQGRFPTEFVTMVGSKLSNALQKGSEECTYLSQECLKTVTTLSCKVLRSSSYKHIEALSKGVEQLLEVLLELQELVLTRESDNSLYNCPALVSSIVTIVHSRPDLTSSRVIELAALLCKHACLESMTVKDTSYHLERLSAVINVLSLPAALSHVVTEPSPELKITVSWERSLEVLSCILEEFEDCGEILLCLHAYHNERRESERTALSHGKDLLVELCIKLYGVMSQLLEAASRQEISCIFELLSKQDSRSVVQSGVFFCCWDVVLDSKLSQECRRELRRWLTKVLLKCECIAALHQNNAIVNIMAVQLATRLVAIPPRVGLDSRSVMISLHLCSCLDHILTQSGDHVMTVIESVAQLMSTLIRNHTTVATSAPAPVLSTTNKLLSIMITRGQEVERLSHEENMMPAESLVQATRVKCLVQCAGLVSRVVELLSHQKAFSKFIPYTIGEFVATSQKCPLHPSVKRVLLPGIFSVLKLCSDRDTAFIQASLDVTARENFQSLLGEFQKYYKFKGRV